MNKNPKIKENKLLSFINLNDDQQNQKNMNNKINFNKDEYYYISFEIRIKDSGKGISKENHNKLFINFSKLADEEGMNKQGTGLGLSICKHIIEKMGGDVKV